MSLFAVLIVLVSAVIHSAWNLLGKAKSSTPAFFCLASLGTALIMSPFLVWMTYFASQNALVIPNHFWQLLIFSGFFQMIYMAGLARAYQNADVGVVYPIARALPVLMVASLSTLIAGHSMPLLAWVGMIIVTLGCLLVPLTTLKNWHWKQYKNKGCLWALIAAIGTAGYSVIDKEALNLLHASYQNQLPSPFLAIYFLGLQFSTTGLWLALGLCWSSYRKEMRFSWQYRKSALLAGIMMGVTYGMVLYAMTLTDNVSYVVALRQASIPIGVLLAVLILKEKWYLTRIAGAGIIFTGLVFTAV